MSDGGMVVRCEARGFAFDVHCDPGAHPTIASMLAALDRGAEGIGPPTAAAFSVTHDGGDPGRWSVHMDGRLMMSGEQMSEALDALVTFVNQHVVLSRDDVLSVHAAAVAVDGAGIVLPAASGSGKTTLCARLIQRGASYLTDETVGIDRTGDLLGYAKPLGFKAGTVQSFGDDHLSDLAFDVGPHWVWQVPAARLGASVVDRASPAVVALPRFERDGRLRIDPIPRHEAARGLVAEAQNLSAFGVPEALEAVARVVARSEGYAVSFGDARAAAEAILERLPPTRADAAPFRVIAPSARAAGHHRGGASPSSDVSALCFDDGALLVRGISGTMATVNRVGALVWPLLVTGDGDVNTIAAELSGVFDASGDRIRADVAAWIDLLVEQGFVSRE